MVDPRTPASCEPPFDEILLIRLDHDTKLGLADFAGTGKAAVAAFGTSAVGAPGVYIKRRK